ncbi:hypothetical protein BSKO_00923 [Bryopsis sp. KO-2023]|nr:hypothetical protein BSKO_00923 [Bryopsis sp. KO-2023]
MLRLGLVSSFKTGPIKFRQTTVKHVSSLKDPLGFLSNLVQINSESLLRAVEACRKSAVGCFRVGSNFCPLITHPQFGYQLDDLPNFPVISRNLQRCHTLQKEYNIRLAMHPSCYVILNSPNRRIVERSIEELEYHQMLAELVGVDVINIHGGGGYGDKKSALKRFARNFEKLSPGLRGKLTVENDDRTYTPKELLPLCHHLGIPLVYDVHHHQCLPDGASIQETTDLAIQTWNREPLFHVSSPANGWDSPQLIEHHDYIDCEDFPEYWEEEELGKLTVEVEAKAKEHAVARLRRHLRSRGVSLWQPPEEHHRWKVRLDDHVESLINS